MSRYICMLGGSLVLIMELAGCTGKTLVFGTATKFGLDISQRPDQMVEVSLGYDRFEVASIPAKEEDSDRSGTDTYAVLGVFGFSYGNPWTDEPLVIRQFFATGWAARHAADDPLFKKYFGQKSGDIARAAEAELKAQRAKQGTQ